MPLAEGAKARRQPQQCFILWRAKLSASLPDCFRGSLAANLNERKHGKRARAFAERKLPAKEQIDALITNGVPTDDGQPMLLSMVFRGRFSFCWLEKIVGDELSTQLLG